MDFIFDPSLVLYLPLHELDGAAFTSKDAYGHLCTAYGALWRPNGRNFDGDDYIDCGNNAVLRQSTGFTIEGWIKPDNLDAAYCILSVPYHDHGGWADPYVAYALITTNAPRLHADYNIGGVGGYSSLNSNTDLTPDAWIHAAYTFDGTTHIIYLNGLNDGSKVDAGLIGFDPAPKMSLGTVSLYAPQQPFLGLIGEARFYSRCLNPLEIQHNYLATKWRYR